MRQDTMPWCRQAEADLHSAELMLQGGQWYAVSWFSHQAAEKAVKALYIEESGLPANRIHNLIALGRSVGAPPDVGRDLRILEPQFDLTRYPDATGNAPVDTMTRRIATRDIEASRRILLWATSQL
jgi:HEPN domain-containing protein